MPGHPPIEILESNRTLLATSTVSVAIVVSEHVRIGLRAHRGDPPHPENDETDGTGQSDTIPPDQVSQSPYAEQSHCPTPIPRRRWQESPADCVDEKKDQPHGHNRSDAYQEVSHCLVSY
jgi:hypothetical protein